ncbi:MAG: kinase [Thermoleophilaceae bacterium]|nr:kinase [Thermoleophilaceae bacterium]
MSGAPKTITVFSHMHVAQTGDALRSLVDRALESGIQVRIPATEVEKHGFEEREGAILGADPAGDTDLAVVLGGDGSILTVLRIFAGRAVPTFAFNYGAIGFLSSVDHGCLDDGLQRVLAGDYETIALPALAVSADGERRFGVNDISFHRQATHRVAELEYSVAGEQLGKVRCDGLVVSTPVGSTGYNLANGGPVLAWGVQGYVVSFIAPHTLTARALVVAPDDHLSVLNLSSHDDVEVTTDGRKVETLGPGEETSVSFHQEQVQLAQIPGSTFYHRFRDKFGRLAY